MGILEVFLVAIGFAAIVLAGVLIGGFLVFKSKASPGESFFHTPKGQVFTIPDAEAAPDEVDTTITDRTKQFVEMLGGKL